MQELNTLTITARQYGEVVLPDAASGNNPDTPRQRGHETVPVQGGYGALFAVQACPDRAAGERHGYKFL